MIYKRAEEYIEWTSNYNYSKYLFCIWGATKVIQQSHDTTLMIILYANRFRQISRVSLLSYVQTFPDALINAARCSL